MKQQMPPGKFKMLFQKPRDIYQEVANETGVTRAVVKMAGMPLTYLMRPANQTMDQLKAELIDMVRSFQKPVELQINSYWKDE